MPPPSRKKLRITKKAACIRGTAATARLTRKQMPDSPHFDPATSIHPVQSGKFTALLDTIRTLDARDRKTHGTTFKHFIFTDLRDPGYGVKALASYMIAGGFEFRMRHAKKTVMRNGVPVETKSGQTEFVERDPVAGGCNGFAILQNNPLWKNPLSVQVKKQILSTYNARPDNINGELLRIILLDSKYKEGIDLFDVKYVHLLEPAIAPSDLKQAVGRATRFCGQRGLHFVPRRGWPLQVYIYNTEIPGRPPFTVSDEALQKIDAHTLMLQHSGLDLALLNLSKELTRLAILSAVDYDLNYKINNFKIEEDLYDATEIEEGVLAEVAPTQKGGNARLVAIHDIRQLTPETIAQCVKRKNAMFPFTRAKMFRVARELGLKPAVRAKRAWYCAKLQDNQEYLDALLADKGPASSAAAIEDATDDEEESRFPEPPPLPAAAPPAAIAKLPARLHSLPFSAFQTKIRELYAAYAWDAPIVKNGCEVSAAGAAPGRAVTFTKTQDFIRHYLRPDAAEPKGLFAWHSVGTGKTCMAVAAATTAFERAGYTILWVTRNSLMSDIYKNIFGAVCSIPIQEALATGATLPTKPAAQKRMLSRTFLPPISYRTFQNALEQKNELGRMLYAANPSDPLRKTFLVIDEIHKLRDGDLGASEAADFAKIQSYIHQSYARSGDASVRPLLMTATPISDSPADLLEILNTLIVDPAKRFPPLESFRAEFTQADGSFTDAGAAEFQERVKGLISYLNREYDPTTFAQPVFHTVRTPIGAHPSIALADLVADCDPYMDTPEPDPACADLDAKIAEAEAAVAAAAPRSEARKTATALLKTRKAEKKRECGTMSSKVFFAKSVWPAAKTCFKDAKSAARATRKLKAQLTAMESCFKDSTKNSKNTKNTNAATKKKRATSQMFPSMKEFRSALQARYASDAGETNNNARSVAAVISE